MAATTAAAISAPPSGVRTDAFRTRIVVMVDEATEPSLADADASRRRAELVAMANSASQATAPVGSNIAFAIRKRLKSDDATAVINTLKLLDELMRSCPYFYRYVADDKMFRRLWRFVVPDYKNGVRSMLPFPGHRSRTAADLRATAGRPDIAHKVLILIRAWAEELSVMYNGKFDPAAGFLIERYKAKRDRVKFPDVPSSELPWVCPVGPSTSQNASNASRSSYRGGAGSSSRRANGALPESLGLDEVENTVNLFENILENATNVSELKTDVSKELVSRCRIIGDNLDKLSMSMDKEEELTRAIRVSEKLSRALNAYDMSIRSGEVNKPIPVISGLGESPVNSDHEDYDAPRPVDTSSMEYRSERSMEDDRNHAARFVPPTPVKSGVRSKIPRAATARFGKDRKKLSTSRSHDSHLDGAASEPELTAQERQERREEAQRRFHREYVASKRGTAATRRERSLSPAVGDRRLERSKTHATMERPSRSKRREDRSESDSDAREIDDEQDRREDRDRRSRRNEDDSASRKKTTKREMKKSSSTYVSGAGTSSAKPPKSRKGKDGKRRIGRSATALDSNTLVDVGASDLVADSGDSSDDVRRPRDIFSKLGERYEQGDDDQQTSTTDTEVTGNMQSLNITPASNTPANPMNMYQTAPYGGVMMMPPGMAMMNPMGMYNTVNPMAMYGSVNPMMQGMPQPNGMMQPNPMFGAYNTVNPAMYYNSMNPMANPMAAYASHNPVPAMFPNPYMTQTQPPQQPVQQVPQGSPPQLTSPPLQPQPQQQQQSTPPMQAMPGALQLMPQPLQQQQVSPLQPHQQGQQQPPAMPPQPTPQMPMMMFPTAPYTLNHQTPAAPPPPPPASYTTVSNAPLPPPNMPPPPPMQQPMQPVPQPTTDAMPFVPQVQQQPQVSAPQQPPQIQLQPPVVSAPLQPQNGSIPNEQAEGSATAAPVSGAAA